MPSMNRLAAVRGAAVKKLMGGGGDKVLNCDTINPHLIKAQYAVRGELAIRAEELRNVYKMLFIIPSPM